jgi:hypothetical protein
LTKRSSKTIHQGSKSSLRDLKKPFKLVMPDIASLAAIAALVPAAYSGNKQERDIDHDVPVAENAAPVLSSEISTDTCREAPVLKHGAALL